MSNDKRLIENIYELAKSKNIKINDLEKQANVTEGYLARLKSIDKYVSPSVDTVLAIAEKLNTTVEYLVKHDPNSTGKDDDFAIEIINKLIEKTTSSNLKWDRELMLQALYNSINSYGDVVHTLFEERRVVSGNLKDTREPAYYSRFHPGKICELAGDIFSADLSNVIFSNSKMYVTKIKNTENQKIEYEVYLLSNKKLLNFCHYNSMANSQLNDTVERFYNVLNDPSNVVTMDNEAKQLLKILSTNKGDKKDESPF